MRGPHFRVFDTSSVPVVRGVGEPRPADDGLRSRTYAPGETIDAQFDERGALHPGSVRATVVANGPRVVVRAHHSVFRDGCRIIREGDELALDRAWIHWVHGV